LGLSPIEPGWRRWQAKPWLLRSRNMQNVTSQHGTEMLDFVSGSAPTPHGTISFSVDASAGTLEIDSPAGTTGEVYVPLLGAACLQLRNSHGTASSSWFLRSKHSLHDNHGRFGVVSSVQGHTALRLEWIHDESSCATPQAGGVYTVHASRA